MPRLESAITSAAQMELTEGASGGAPLDISDLSLLLESIALELEYARRFVCGEVVKKLKKASALSLFGSLDVSRLTTEIQACGVVWHMVWWCVVRLMWWCAIWCGVVCGVTSGVASG